MATVDSKLVKILKNAAFKSDGQSEQQIDVNFLICYGLLLCSGKPRDKAECFYNILQDGGLTAHTFITATDKDIHPIFEKMCLLVTVHLFEFMKETLNMENDWESIEDKLCAAHEKVREDMFLDEVFGSNSKMANEPFLEAVSKKTMWVFNSNDLRRKVFEAAEVKFTLPGGQ